MSFVPHQLMTPVQADLHPGWSPDGSHLVFERVEGGVSHLYKAGADGTGITQLTTSPKSDTWPSWSPNF